MPKLCIRGQIAPKHRPALRWLGARVLAAALVLVASVATVVRWYERSRSHQSLGKLADLRITDLASTTPVDVVSSDRHTVKPWFQGKLPFTFDLPELQGSGYTLVGGRVAYFERERGAHLLYNLRAHHISVFICRDRPEIERVFPAHDSSTRVLSFYIESWAAGGLRYFVFAMPARRASRDSAVC